MNNKNSILLVHPDFDPSNAPDSILLLKIGGNSFSYAILDNDTNQVNAVYDHQECLDVPAAFSSRIKNDSYLSIPFRSIKAAVYTENTVTIPVELFDNQQLNQYAKFFPEAQGNNLYIQSLDDFPFKSIFTLDEEIEETIHTSFSQCAVFDHQAPLLALSSDTASTGLILDFVAGSFNAMYMKLGNLVFHRYFEMENEEEFTYYLLYIIKQLKISNPDTEVFLTGIIHDNDAYYKCITKYFQLVSFRKAHVVNTDESILDDMPAHYYSSLLALNSCE